MKWFLVILVLLYIKRGESVDCTKDPKNAEARLKNELLCDYDKTQRPVLNHKNKTVVGIRMMIRDYDLDEVRQKMKIETWMKLSWLDEHLHWKPEEHDKINVIVTNSDNIWIPEISSVLDNTAKESCVSTNCKIHFSGYIKCSLPCTYQTICEMDFSYWPYDRHNCSMTMLSWFSTGDEINYGTEKTTVYKTFRTQHDKYNFISTGLSVSSGERNSSYLNESISFPSVSFYFVVERHVSFEQAFILLPVLVLIAFNLIGLWLEPGCFERITLLVTNLILHFLLVIQLHWYIPNNGENPPKIVIYFRDSMLMTGVLLLETVITKSIVNYQIVSVPNWIETSTHYIANSAVGKYFISVNINEKSLTINTDSIDDIEGGQLNTQHNITWKLFAKLIDRLLFIIYLIVYIIIYSTLYMPHYVESKDITDY